MKALRSTKSDVLVQGLYTEHPSHAFPLLRTKLIIPHIHSTSISRPWLLNELTKGANKKLTIVSAPTGFGKTALLSEWATQSDKPVLWVSLSESDNNPIHFWTYLMNALVTLSPYENHEIRELLTLIENDVFLAAFSNFITDIAQEFILILDNYHVICNPLIHANLTSLLEYSPAHMHLFISSRTRPPLPIPRLRAYRQLHELRASDLLFNLNEVQSFLQQHLGREPSPQLVQTVKEHTTGWIALLHLLVLWLQGKGESTIRELNLSNHEYIHEYLQGEILQQQQPVLTLFLLHTSILTQLYSPLCDVLMEQNNSLLLLEELEQAHLILRDKHSYKYPPILQSFLHHRLNQSFPELVPTLHQRAFTWYVKQNMHRDALHHALALHAINKNAHVLLMHMRHLLENEDFEALFMCIQYIPEALIRLYPLLCIINAWRFFTLHQAEEAKMWLKQTGHLDKRSSTKHPIPDNLSPEVEEYESIYNTQETSLLYAHLVTFWEHIGQAPFFHLHDPTSLVNESSFLHHIHWLQSGMINCIHGDVATAEEQFTTIVAYHQKLNSQKTYTQIAGYYGILLTLVAQGKQKNAFAIADKVLQWLTHADKKIVQPLALSFYAEMGWLLYEENKLEDALQYANQLFLDSHEHHPAHYIYACVLLSRIKQALGDVDEAYRLLLKAEEGVTHIQNIPWIYARMAEQTVHLALARKDIQRAHYWSHITLPKHYQTLSTVLSLRVLLAKSLLCEAVDVAKTFQSNTTESAADLKLSLLHARTYHELGRKSQARQILLHTLQKAEDEGYIRLFLDEGPLMTYMLRHYLATYEEQNNQYVQLLLNEMAKENVLHSPGGKEYQTQDTHTHGLSEREQDIVRGITAGLTNQEIAQQMMIADSTVKWHVKNIYSKLQVHNRAQAIITAQKLGLV